MLTALLAGVPLPMILIGTDARIQNANKAAIALLGENIEGRHYTTAIRQPELVGAVEKVMSGAPERQTRYIVTGPSRDTIYRVLVAPLAGEGVSLAFEDITDIEQAGEMRRDFVANVSHELRTPLTALLGFIETLKGAARDDPVARARFLGIMEREAFRMNRLVGDLLSLSRVEAEERVRPSESVDVRMLSRSVATTMRGLAEQAGVEIRLEFPDEVPRIPADPDQLTQVLHNLVENAIKYGGGGHVDLTIAVSSSSDPKRGPSLTISVTDHGDGIDPIHLARLTERFYRVDTHRSREQGGTGLGLAIVKHIVNRHRGRLKIESRRGEGSTFSVILPMQ